MSVERLKGVSEGRRQLPHFLFPLNPLQSLTMGDREKEGNPKKNEPMRKVKLFIPKGAAMLIPPKLLLEAIDAKHKKDKERLREYNRGYKAMVYQWKVLNVPGYKEMLNEKAKAYYRKKKAKERMDSIILWNYGNTPMIRKDGVMVPAKWVK